MEADLQQVHRDDLERYLREKKKEIKVSFVSQAAKFYDQVQDVIGMLDEMSRQVTIGI